MVPHAVSAEPNSSEIAQGRDGAVLTIGRVSGNPRKHVGRLGAFGDYLVRQLKDHGITRTEIVLKPEQSEMIAAAVREEIDLISETAFTAAELEQRGQMEIALVEWKRGLREYATAIIVRKDSDIKTLEDLRGRKISFEDSGSTSGFFLPYVEIMDAGLRLAPEKAGDAVAGLVRYNFAGSEINVVGSVIRSRADAGAISDEDLEDIEVVTRRFKPQLRVLHYTRSVPRSVILMRKSLDPSIKAALRNIMLEMHQTDEGRAVLRRYFKLTRFSELDAESEAAFDWVRDAVRTHRGR